ncbi:MAG: AAA family ATPase [Acidobacteria bacterium]|nr:MAG: AAA family ATPase [Acidobacteriota bacterium]
MKKVLVIGSCGSGKSVFSRQLGEVTGLPVVHLDRYFWSAGWTEPDREVWRVQVEEFLKRDSWIIDGNYGATMEMRLAHCDTVVFLDLPRHVCTWRVMKRTVTYRGRTRPDLADGCPEKFDWSFIKWTWNYPTRSRPHVLERLSRVADKVNIVTLSTHRDVETYLRTLRPSVLA